MSARNGDGRVGPRRKRPAQAAQNRRDIDAYCDYMRAAGKAVKTISLRRWQLEVTAEDLNIALRTATTRDLVRYFAARQAWSPATRYSNRATLRDFFKFAVASKWMKTDPARALPPIQRPQKNLPAAPEAVIEAAAIEDPRVELMVALAARQGLRRAEIVGIHRHDMVPTADGSWVLIVHGKGGKDRTVPLHDDIAARMLAQPSGWLFPSPAGGHLSASYAGKLLSDALGEGWSAHSLRRRFATQVYTGSHDLRAVQLLLGHADLATTQRYLDTQTHALRDALAFS